MNFVQWRDRKNGNYNYNELCFPHCIQFVGEAWGLNFTSKSDADNFVKSCSVSGWAIA